MAAQEGKVPATRSTSWEWQSLQQNEVHIANSLSIKCSIIMVESCCREAGVPVGGLLLGIHWPVIYG